MFKYQNLKADAKYESWKNDFSLIPFKYLYDGKEFCGFPFEIRSKKIETDGAKETQTVTFFVDGNLNITLVLTHYYDYGATEFTVWFENAGKENSGVIEDAKLDTFIAGANPYIRGVLGDHKNQYRPYNRPLGNEYFESLSGRPTHEYFPYFNIENDCGGAMIAIGWSGRWSVMMCPQNDQSRVIARYAMGLKTYLKPKEKIRTPLFFIGEYTIRDEYYATNYWRSWFMKYNLPKADGAGNELKPFSTCSIAGDTGLENCDGSISENKYSWKPSLQKLFDNDVQLDFRWFDAGYYPDPTGVTRNDYWGYVGAWVLDENKWGKNGEDFKKSVDYAHENGMKTLIWVEPERVSYVDGLVKNYGYNAEWAVPRFPKEYPFNELYILNDFSNPNCLEWTKKWVTKLLKDNKIDLYREDFNRDPAYAWEQQDRKEGVNRWGITECKAVAGHYQFWQDMIDCTTSYGGCGFVDSCASGGGRNDLQSLRYAVPLLRSDSDRTTTALRLSMSSSFNKWIPFHGACHLEKDADLECLQDGRMDTYAWRASYLPILNVMGGRFSQDENYDFETLKFGINEWKKINKYLTQDFYPLTGWKEKTDTSGFTAHCYMDSETDEGILLAFRMENCQKSTLSLKFPFVKDGEKYLLTDFDTEEKIEVTASEMTIVFDCPRQAKLLGVKKL